MTRYLALGDTFGTVRLDLDGNELDELGEEFLDFSSSNSIVAFFNGMDINFAGASDVLVQESVELSTSTFGTVTITDTSVSGVATLTFQGFSELTASYATYNINVTFQNGVFVQGFHQFNRDVVFGSIFGGAGIQTFDARMVFNGSVGGDITYNSTLATDYLLFNGQAGGNVYNNGPLALDVTIGATGTLQTASGLPLKYAGTGGINLTVNGTIGTGFSMGSGDDTLMVSTANLFSFPGIFINMAGGDDEFEMSTGTWSATNSLFFDTGDDSATIGAGSTFLGGLLMGDNDDTVTVYGALGSSTQTASVNMGLSGTSADIFTATFTDIYADVDFSGAGVFALAYVNYTGSLTASSGAVAITLTNSQHFAGGTITLSSADDTVLLSNSTSAGGINTGGGKDVVTIENSSGLNIGDLGGGSDRLNVISSQGVVFNLGTENDTVDLDNSAGTIDMGAGDDSALIGQDTIASITGGAGVDTFVFDATGGHLTISDWEAGEKIIITDLVDENATLRYFLGGELLGTDTVGQMRGNGNRMAIDIQVSLFSESIEFAFVNTTTGFSLGSGFGGIGFTIEGDINNFFLEDIVYAMAV